MSVDLTSSLLDTKVDDIKRPKPLPVGTYSFLIKESTLGESSQKKTPYVRFDCQPIGFEADVNTAELDGIDLGKRSIGLDFFLTADALWRAKEFFEKIGLESAGRSLREVIAECAGKQFKAYVKHEASQREGDDSKYSRIDTSKILKV